MSIARFRVLSASACATLTFAPQSFAQNQTQTNAPAGDLPAAATLIQQATEALASAEKLAAIQSLSVLGEMAFAQDGEQQRAALDAKFALPEKFHIVAELGPEATAIATFDGERGWDRDPGTLDYALMDQGEERMFDLVVPHGWMLSIAERYPKQVTQETIEIDGVRHYRIALTDTEEVKHADLFIAIDTGRFAAMETSDPNGAPARFTVTEWKEFDGVSLPSAGRLDVGMGEEGRKINLTYDEVQFNGVDDATFDMPDEVRRQVAEDDDDDGGAAGGEGAGAAATKPGAT